MFSLTLFIGYFHILMYVKLLVHCRLGFVVKAENNLVVHALFSPVSLFDIDCSIPT